MDWRAMLVMATDCISQSLPTNFITTQSAFMMMKGVASMDSTIDARIGLNSDGGTNWFSPARVSSTNPNSPACARYRPVRTAVPRPAPIQRASAAMTASLNSTGSVTRISTRGQRSSTSRQSSIMPMVMKNRPNNTSWNGRMSVST